MPLLLTMATAAHMTTSMHMRGIYSYVLVPKAVCKVPCPSHLAGGMPSSDISFHKTATAGLEAGTHLPAWPGFSTSGSPAEHQPVTECDGGISHWLLGATSWRCVTLP